MLSLLCSQTRKNGQRPNSKQSSLPSKSNHMGRCSQRKGNDWKLTCIGRTQSNCRMKRRRKRNYRMQGMEEIRQMERMESMMSKGQQMRAKRSTHSSTFTRQHMCKGRYGFAYAEYNNLTLLLNGSSSICNAQSPNHHFALPRVYFRVMLCCGCVAIYRVEKMYPKYVEQGI